MSSIRAPISSQEFQSRVSNLFKMAPNPGAWVEIMGYLKQNPDYVKAISSKGESFLHWAILGDISASIDLITMAPELVELSDSNGRRPFDWAVEKLFFLSDETSHGMKNAFSKQETIICSTSGVSMPSKDILPMGMTWAELSVRSGSLTVLENMNTRNAIGRKQNLMVCWALSKNRTEATMKWLLENGCSFFDISNGRPAIDQIGIFFLEGKIDPKCIKEIEESGIDIYQEDQHGLCTFERLADLKGGIHNITKFCNAFEK